tara:strand:+ start:576 stop:851 length:276 start_codon:yes stop_codon:yes gene_type:complete
MKFFIIAGVGIFVTALMMFVPLVWIVTKEEEMRKKAFVQIIKFALSEGVAVDDFCDEFKISPATVKRWRDGRSIPPDLIRKRIVDWIKNKK